VALRVLELDLTATEESALQDILRDRPVLQVWPSGGPPPDHRHVRILLDAEHVEALSDALVSRFGSREDFRMILLPVEATMPRPEGDEETPPEPAPAAGSKERPRISRDELYEDVAEGSRLTPVYAVLVALSTVVAAVGLLRGDVAIIVGAMVIAPLLGPNVALALACTLGDTSLARRALVVSGVGIAIAGILSVLIGLSMPVDPTGPEIASRTGVDLGDIVLALAAGAAGSLAFTSGVSTILVGVMVAVALLPPLVAAGLLAGAGHAMPALGAATLAVTNVTCVSLAAVVTFLAREVRPRTWWEAERAHRATRIAVTTWILMLLIVVAAIVLSYLGIV